MKSIIRTFAISLVVTGAFASAHLSQTVHTAPLAAVKVSAMPPPNCPYNDPNACGFGQLGH